MRFGKGERGPDKSVVAAPPGFKCDPRYKGCILMSDADYADYIASTGKYAPSVPPMPTGRGTVPEPLSWYGLINEGLTQPPATSIFFDRINEGLIPQNSPPARTHFYDPPPKLKRPFSQRMSPRSRRQFGYSTSSSRRMLSGPPWILKNGVNEGGFLYVAGDATPLEPVTQADYGVVIDSVGRYFVYGQTNPGDQYRAAQYGFRQIEDPFVAVKTPLGPTSQASIPIMSTQELPASPINNGVAPGVPNTPTMAVQASTSTTPLPVPVPAAIAPAKPGWLMPAALAIGAWLAIKGEG